MHKFRTLFFAATLCFLCFPTLADEAPKSKQIFESKSLSIWYSKYPNTNYPDEFGTYKYFWIGFQTRGQHSDPDCIFKKSQIISELNFSFKDLSKTFTFTKTCPNIAVTGDTGFELKKYFSDAELEEIRKQPHLLKLTILNSKVAQIDSQ